MHDAENSDIGPDSNKKTGQVGSLSAAQNKKIADVISAARATLEDEVEYVRIVPTISEPEPSNQQYLHKLRILTVSMWIMVITTVLLAFLVLAASFYQVRRSQTISGEDVALGTAEIILGISAVATCALILVRNYLLRRR